MTPSSPTAPPPVWHYTAGRHLPSILSDGIIELATTGLDPTSERPAVWCSVRPDWEPTADKPILDPTTGEWLAPSRAVTVTHGGGLVRIEVARAAAPHRWDAWCRTSRCSIRAARFLRTAAECSGSRVSDWRIGFAPIPRARWRRIERWNAATGTWESSEERALTTPPTTASEHRLISQ